MSDCWNILGISPTPLTSEIKRAYIRLLKITKPDEDPQGFMRLRQAYEAALHAARYLSTDLIPSDTNQSAAVAKESKIDAQPISAISQEIDSVNALYQAWINLYQDRKNSWNLSAWLNLLKSPVFENIELSRSAYGQLIYLFTQNPFAPSRVFSIIAEMSDFDELYSSWGKFLPEGIADGFYNILRYTHLRMASENLQFFPGNENELGRLVEIRREIENAFINRIRFNNEEHGSLENIGSLVNNALAIWPQDYEVRSFYGRLLWAARFESQAYEQFSAIDITQLQNESIKSEVLLYLFEISQRLQLPDVSLRANQLLLRDADNIHALKYLAKQHYLSHQYEEALSLLSELVATHPVDFELRTLATQIRLGYLERLSDPKQYLRKLEILYELQRYDECIALYDQHEDDFLRAGSLMRAFSYLKKDNDDAAFRDFNDVCQYTTQDNQNIGELVKEIAFHGAETLNQEWLDDYGYPALDFLTRSQSNDYSYYLGAALLAYRFAELIEEGDNDPSEWYEYASCYIRRALNLNPTDDYVNFKAGHIFTKTEDYRDAVKTYQQCQSTYNNWYILHDNLAICFKNLELYEDAIGHHRRSFSMSVHKPYQTWQLKNIIELYEKLGDKAEADKCRTELAELEAQE